MLEDGLGNYFEFIVHSNPFLSADISRKPVLLCMVQNLSGFCFLFFYFSCFLRERGEEMDKITNSALFSQFSIVGCRPPCFILHRALWLHSLCSCRQYFNGEQCIVLMYIVHIRRGIPAFYS